MWFWLHLEYVLLWKCPWTSFLGLYTAVLLILLSALKYGWTILFCPFLKHCFWNYFILVSANYSFSVRLRTDRHINHSHLCSIHILFLHFFWESWLVPSSGPGLAAGLPSAVIVSWRSCNKPQAPLHWASGLLPALHHWLQLQVCVMTWRAPLDTKWSYAMFTKF